MVDEIVFLAGNHLYPRVAELAPEFLEWQRPDWIVLELDEVRAQQREQPLSDWVAQTMRQHPNAVRETVQWCLGLKKAEYEVIQNYAKDHHVPVIIADTKFANATLTRELKKRTDAHTYALPLEKVVNIGKLIDTRLSKELIQETMMRDAEIESTCRMLNGKVVSHNGTAHVYAKYHNLYERFADITRQRYTLADIEMFGVPVEPAIVEKLIIAE
jgi:uncharacterized iron-regulated protein